MEGQMYMDSSPAHTDAPQGGRRKRRRTVLACERCRDRKIRCDGERPACGACGRRKHPDDVGICLYKDSIWKSSQENEYILRLQDRIHHLENGAVSTSVPMENCHSVETTTLTANASGEEGQLGQFQSYQILHGLLHLGSASSYCQTSPSGAAATMTESSDQPQGDEQTQPTGIQSLDPEATDQQQWRQSSILEENVPPSVRPRVVPASLKSPAPVNEMDGSVSAMGVVTVSSESNTFPPDFYGTSSAISFFHRVQRVLRPDKAPKPNSSPNTQGWGWDFGTASTSRFENIALPPRRLADFLLNSYWVNVHTLYPIVHKASFEAVYAQFWTDTDVLGSGKSAGQVGLGSPDCPLSVFCCGLNAMFALGCILSDMPQEEHKLADVFSQRALDLISENWLDNGSLALVQALFIMAQYLQSTDSPTRCWNIVGLALRVAQGQGLYMDPPSNTSSQLELEITRRTWHACLMLDVMTSVMLGRPAVATGESKMPYPAAIDDVYLEAQVRGTQPAGIFSRTTFFVQTTKLYAIFGTVLAQVYKPWQDRAKDEPPLSGRLRNSIISTAVDIEFDILDFIHELPPELSWDNRQTAAVKDWVIERQRSILHTRLLYLKMLLYRPMFHQHYLQAAMERFTRSIKTSGYEAVSQTASSQEIIPNLARRFSKACIESAQDMINLIHNSSQTKAAGAWWYAIFYLFTSGTIIILADLNRSMEGKSSHSSLETSWQMCLHTLDILASKSDTARKCARTLVSLREQAVANQDTLFTTDFSNSQPSKHVEPSAPNITVEQQSSHRIENSLSQAAFHPSLGESQLGEAQIQDFLWHQHNAPFPWEFQGDWWQGSAA